MTTVVGPNWLHPITITMANLRDLTSRPLVTVKYKPLLLWIMEVVPMITDTSGR